MKKLKKEEKKPFIQCCILGAIGGILMAAGDWLLGCVPLQKTDTGMFNRACYLSGAYALWKPALVVGMGALGCFLYSFMVKALNTDIDTRYTRTKAIQYFCGLFTVVVACRSILGGYSGVVFHLSGPRIGAEAAITAVTAYQDDMLPQSSPCMFRCYCFWIHFVMLLAGKTRYPGWILAFHPVTWNILLVAVPDIAQAMQVPTATWMSVMSQSSTNTAIVIWCIAAAVYEKNHTQ